MVGLQIVSVSLVCYAAAIKNPQNLLVYKSECEFLTPARGTVVHCPSAPLVPAFSPGVNLYSRTQAYDTVSVCTSWSLPRREKPVDPLLALTVSAGE